MKRLLAAALCAALCGCTTMRSLVVGGCELPQRLAERDAVSDLPSDHPLTPAEQRALWAKDRKHLKQSVDHGNALIDYVGEQCK